MAGVGTFQTVTGVVTVTRGDIVGQASAGDSLYRGDVIETADDSAAILLFSDGTRLRLYGGTRVALDDYVCEADGSPGAGLIRIAKGVFAIVAGKLARAGRLVIETPLGQIRSRGSAAGIGSLALGILTFKLITELRAQGVVDPNAPANSNADQVTINDSDLKQGKLDYAQGDPNEFTHGAFVIETFDGRHFVVDDVTKTLWIHGSSAEYLATTLAQQLDYFGAKNVADAFHNDPWAQQIHNQRADNATGNGGSSTSDTILGFGTTTNNQGPPPIPPIPPLTGNNSGNSGSNGQTTTQIIPPSPPPPPVVVPLPQTGVESPGVPVIGGGSGGEGMPIALALGIQVTNGATLGSVTLSNIPPGATLSNSDNDVPPIVGGSVTLNASQIVGLSITAPNDQNFVLTVAATQQDSAGISQPGTGTEQITVNPLAPTIAPTPGAFLGAGLPVALNLNLVNNIVIPNTTPSGPPLNGIIINSEGTSNPDNPLNTLNSLTITVPAGEASATFANSAGPLTLTNDITEVTLSDGSIAITFDALAIKDGALNGLTITPTTSTSFTLQIAATEVDSEGNLSISGTGTETITLAAPGTIIYWTNLGNGSWFVSTNWTDNNNQQEVPLASQTIFIDPSHNGSSAAVTVTLGANVDAGVGDSLVIGNSSTPGIHSTLDIVDNSLTISNSITVIAGLIEISGGGVLDMQGTTITDDNVGTEQIDTGSTLLVDNAHVTLNGDGTGRVVLAGGTITGAAKANELENFNKTIVGAGTISNLTLVNDAAGVIDATGLLVLATGNTISNVGGLMEATGSGVLQIDDNVVNSASGELLATGGGELDVQSTTITDNTHGFEEIDTGSTLLVDNAHVTLNGDGTGRVVLAGGTITGAAKANELENFNKTIVGAGTISNLTLVNDAKGVIDATGLLVLSTGNTISNTGLMEATAGGILDVKDLLSNSETVEATGTGSVVTLEGNVTNTAGTLWATAGGELDVKAATISDYDDGAEQIDTGSELLVDTTYLTLNGDGTGKVVMSGTALITGKASGDELENVNKTISGAGTISNLTLVNDSAGTIDANVSGQTLVLSTGHTISNAGVLEATAGGILQIVDSVTGGSAIINGGTLIYGASWTGVATSFDGLGTLVLDTNALIANEGTIHDFEEGDTIDLAAIPFINTGSAANRTQFSYNASHDTLTVSTPGAPGDPSITIQLAGTYSASNFHFSQDGTGTAVTLNSGEGPEPPTLKLGGTTATVNVDGTVTLPSITVTPVDSDDTLTVTIAGLPSGATITNGSNTYPGGSSITIADPNGVGNAFTLSSLTLNDGGNVGNFTLTVTANNTTFDGTGGEVGSSQPKTIGVIVNKIGPAGLAGSPINLALSNPPAASGGPVTVTISGLPADAQLNEGTNLGNGTWSVQTNDLTSLTVLTAFVGAMVLSVNEVWANTDGSVGTATIADNLEVYAPHSPIFALASNDTLTGAGANDLFVFAQPIGNDVIHNFNVASDQIDLIGFSNVASFSDLQVADDSNGNAVITVGAGETITLQGVDAATLTAGNFEFGQTPTLNNSSTMMINDGAVLPLSGIVDNTGVIDLNSTGDPTEIVIIGNGATLEGHGQVIMSDSPENFIVGSDPNTTLTNVDNTISGVGQIGIGDGNLTLVNEAAGTIDANIAGGVLTLNTGNTITNYGVLEASNGGTLQIQDAVTGGTAVIAGGTIEFDAASSIAVTFDNGSSGTTYGVLVLIDPSHFTGDISGFTGTAADLAHSDGIDVVGINFNSGLFSDSYNASTGILTLTDGANTDSLDFVGFTGNISNFNFAEDANGTGTLVTDPPGLDKSPTAPLVSSDTSGGSGTQSSNPESNQPGQSTSTAIGGDGDHFVFTPGLGAETVTNFNTQQDTLEFDHFADAQTVQQLESLITNDAHGDAVINLGHNDSVTLTGTTTNELQHVIQAGHVLLH